MHRSRPIHRSILAAALACVAVTACAADVAAAGMQVVPEAQDWVFWTHNGRTYRLPAIPLDGGDANPASRAPVTPNPAAGGLVQPKTAMTRQPKDGFSGLTILIGGIVCSVMVGLGAAWGIRRRLAYKEAEKTVLVTATGLIVSIEDTKKGTGLITLNRRERSSAMYRAADPAIAAAVAEAGGDPDLPGSDEPHDDEVAVAEEGVVDPNGEFTDGAAEFDEASVEVSEEPAEEPVEEEPAAESADDAAVAEAGSGDTENAFEAVEGDDSDSDVRVVSDRIREKYRRNGTRRYIPEES